MELDRDVAVRQVIPLGEPSARFDVPTGRLPFAFAAMGDRVLVSNCQDERLTVLGADFRVEKQVDVPIGVTGRAHAHAGDRDGAGAASAPGRVRDRAGDRAVTLYEPREIPPGQALIESVRDRIPPLARAHRRKVWTQGISRLFERVASAARQEVPARLVLEAATHDGDRDVKEVAVQALRALDDGQPVDDVLAHWSRTLEETWSHLGHRAAMLKSARAKVTKLEREYGAAAATNVDADRPTMRGFKIANGQIGKALRAAKAVVGITSHEPMGPPPSVCLWAHRQ